MATVDSREDLAPIFIGREREMRWLFDRLQGRRGPIVIVGRAGMGKTTLLKRFLASARTRRQPLLLTPNHYRPDEVMAHLSGKIEELYSDRDPPEIVAIDDADLLTERQIDMVTDRILNLKAIRTLIFAMRERPERTRAEVLQLDALGSDAAQQMLRSLLGGDFPVEEIVRAVGAAAGVPLALTLIAELVRGRDPTEINRLLRGDIYSIDQKLILPEQQLIADVKPRFILANEAIIERLRHQPSSIYDLPPRKFEELIADLLSDLGYEVELTPTTRDGGKDILAYMTTPHGKLLCLVEAKRYRRDRPIGVELVRQLYGTLTDAEASSAMLVTTSSFSQDAMAFQQRHKYKLALRDYGHVVEWIAGYGDRRQGLSN